MEEPQDPQCSICHGGVVAPHELDCHHSFCTGCIVSWFRCDHSYGKCPLCRDAPTGGGALFGEITAQDAFERTRLVIREARKKTATKDIIQAAERCRKARTARQDASREHMEYRRENREVLKQIRKLSARKWKLQRHEREVRRRVGFGLYSTPLGDIPVVTAGWGRLRRIRNRGSM